MGAGSFAAYEASYKEIKGTTKGVIPGSALADEGTTAAAPPRAAGVLHEPVSGDTEMVEIHIRRLDRRVGENARTARNSLHIIHNTLHVP